MPTSSHNPDDVDNDDDSFHHTLGLARGQAIPGDALSSVTFTGAKPTGFNLQVLNALVALGATDATV
jgi:hypothetical protein